MTRQSSSTGHRCRQLCTNANLTAAGSRRTAWPFLALSSPPAAHGSQSVGTWRSFSARSRDMATNGSAVDHVLPVVGKPQINQRLQQGIPDTLPGPSPEPDIDRVPLAVALVHVALGATDPQDMQHAIEKPPVVTGRPRPAPTLRRQQRADQFPFRIRQVPTPHDCSQKSSLESELATSGNPFCQHNLVVTA